MSITPLFMDVHERLPEATSAPAVAEANRAYQDVHHRHGVRYLRCWIDEEAGKLFCLTEAPSAQATVAAHREAHGLLADRIYRVREIATPE